MADTFTCLPGLVYACLPSPRIYPDREKHLYKTRSSDQTSTWSISESNRIVYTHDNNNHLVIQFKSKDPNISQIEIIRSSYTIITISDCNLNPTDGTDMSQVYPQTSITFDCPLPFVVNGSHHGGYDKAEE